MATRKNSTEKGRIVQPGMGGFLNPPTHPEHDWHVETDLRRRPENRGGLSLTSATKATWLDPATRAEARKMLKDWVPPSPNSPEIIDWRQQVLGYFKTGYRNPGTPADEQWNASNLIFDRDRDPIANADDHAGVHFIREFYPEYIPTEDDFGGAYWGSSPERATVHESRRTPQRQQQRAGSFVVTLSTGQTARFHDMPRAQAWGHERLAGQPPGTYAAFYRAAVGPGRSDTGAPWTEPYYVLVVDEYGHVRVGNVRDIAPLPAQHPHRGLAAHEALRGAPADPHAAHKLVLFIENESDLSPDGPRGQGRDVLLNALRKWKKGTYNPELAVKLFGYLVETGAKRYAKEFASEREWNTMFPPATRQEAARQLEESFRSSAEQGEYDHVDTRTGGAARGHAREASRDRNRPISMTYGVLPPFEQFERDVHTRIDPDKSDGSVYWPPGTLYPMELVVPDEIAWAEDFGRFEEFRGQYGKRGFRGDEQQIYDFLVFLMDQPDPYEGEEGGSADLASSIMTTLGYEWI